MIIFRMLKYMQNPCWIACMPKRGVTAVLPRGPHSSQLISALPAGWPVMSFGPPSHSLGSHPPLCIVKRGCQAWSGYGLLERRWIFWCRSTSQSLERNASLYVKGSGISPFSSLVPALLEVGEKTSEGMDLTLLSLRQTNVYERINN